MAIIFSGLNIPKPITPPPTPEPTPEHTYIPPTGEYNKTIEFNSILMPYMPDSLGVKSAKDFMETSDKRAALAVLLSSEFEYQKKNFEIDYSLPMYIAIKGKKVQFAMGGKKEYVIVSYKLNPLYTSYRLIKGNNPDKVYSMLKEKNNSIWKVDFDKYKEYLNALAQDMADVLGL